MPRCEDLSLLQRPLHYKREIEPSYCLCEPWPSCSSRPRLIQKVLGRGVQAVFRGATPVLDRGVQEVVRSAARCALHAHGRGAKTDSCGHGFAVLSTQVSTDGLRLKRSRLACVSILK